VRAALEHGDDLSRLMAFVPVARGDFALLAPGTPHAIGAGVTLIEPQRVLPGRVGVTYRYWDWNRRYDPQGRPHPEGAPRALHVDQALRVTDWARASDPTWLRSQRASFGWPELHGRARCEAMCGPEADARVRSDALRVARVLGDGECTLPDWQGLRALTVIEGELELSDDDDAQLRLRIPAGTTAALPAGCRRLRAVLHGAHALLCAVVVPERASG